MPDTGCPGEIARDFAAGPKRDRASPLENVEQAPIRRAQSRIIILHPVTAGKSKEHKGLKKHG